MTPLLFIWEGDAFKPIPRHAKECDQRFVIGQRYMLDEIQERSSKSHAQYFAAVTTAWQNLPDELAAKWATAEHLRKHALIRCGYHDKRSLQASSRAEALRLAAFVRPMDDYAIVTTSGALVEVYTAKSQSYRAMPKDEFQSSKQAVLDWVSGLIGTDAGSLAKNTETTG